MKAGRKQAGPPIGRTGRGELGVGCSDWLGALVESTKGQYNGKNNKHDAANESE